MTKFNASYVNRDGSMFLDCIWAETEKEAAKSLFTIVDTNPVKLGVLFDSDGNTIATFTK